MRGCVQSECTCMTLFETTYRSLPPPCEPQPSLPHHCRVQQSTSLRAPRGSACLMPGYDFVDIGVKYLGQVSMTRKEMEPGQQCKEILHFLTEKSSRKDFRNGINKDLHMSLSNVTSTLIAAPRGGGRAITVPISNVRGIAVDDNKCAILVDLGSGSACVVHAFQFKRKADVAPICSALEQTAAATPRTPLARKRSTGQIKRESAAPSTPAGPSVPPSVPRNVGTDDVTAVRLREAETRIRELEKQLATERNSAAEAERARYQATVRWKQAELEAEKLKTSIADMRTEMAGVAAEMAADMAQVRIEATDMQNSIITNELRDIKAALAVIDARMLKQEEVEPSQLWSVVDESNRRHSTNLESSMSGAPKPSAASQRILGIARAGSNALNIDDVEGARRRPKRDRQSVGTESTDKVSENVEEDARAIAADSSANTANTGKEVLALAVTLLHAKVDELREALSDAKADADDVAREHATYRQRSEERYRMLEQEKNILADTIAGQRKFLAPAEVSLSQDSMNVTRAPVQAIESEIVIHRGPTGFGFSIAGGIDEPVQPDVTGVFVSQIIAGGAAAEEGSLRVEDQIISVNGTILEGLTHNDAVDLLRASGNTVTLLICRKPADGTDVSILKIPVPVLEDEEEVLDIRFTKGPSGLGFSVAGGTDNPVEENDGAIYVTTIIPGGSAELDGRLRVGDRIIEVNGVNLEAVSHADAVAALQQADSVAMRVARLPEALVQELDVTQGGLQLVEDVLVVEFPIANGLGLSISGGIDLPISDDDACIYITGIQPGGAAHKDGRLRVGDRLVEVNGKNVLNARHDDVIAALQSNPEFVKLVVSRLPTSPEERVEIAFNKGPDGLGFSIAGGIDDIDEGDAGIYVTGIAESGAAAQDGRLRVGDKIITVNGASCVSITHAAAVTLLQACNPAVAMVVSRELIVHTEQDRVVVLDIELDKGTQDSFGFNIVGGQDRSLEPGDSSIYVTNIITGGIAHLDGRLKFNDRLVAVNGKPLEDVRHDEAVAALKAGGPKVLLRVARLTSNGATSVEEGEVIVDVEFDRGPSGFGFSIAGGIDDPVEDNDPFVYVTNIIPGGAADQNGLLQVGDKILEVNGHAMASVTHASAVRALQANLQRVHLVVSRFPLEDGETGLTLTQSIVE
eukprot:m.132850 g.132850  ORF g.132850 m.132850 type:complete len:1148 (+) comp9493_c0_seq6:118-3561(+)